MGKKTEKDYFEEVTDEINRVKEWIAKRTAQKMRNKLIQVYDAIIDQFYSRPPQVYTRHDVQWGERRKGVGVNLYRALESHAGEPPKLRPGKNLIDGGIMIDSHDLKDDHYTDSREEVLDMILNKGIRYPATDTRPEMTFEIEYEDLECSAKGTPYEVLEQVRDQLKDVYAEQAIAEAKKELKLKYVKLN